MKKKYIEKCNSLKKCNPWFFWKQCEICDYLFRREKGWHAETGPWNYSNCSIFGPPTSGVIRYLCQTCSPTYKFANDYFLNEKWRPKGSPPKKP